jgi:phospholipase C
MTADLLAVDPIKHVVVLLLENHSFDQMLGAMKQVCAIIPRLAVTPADDAT